MAALRALQNPLSSLYNLNTLLCWRGTFDSNVTYFQNDLVVSSINSASYLLTATSAFGEDPSLNPNWSYFGLAGPGVQVAKGSQYIEVSGSGTNPTVSNLGVIETILTPPLYSSSGDPQNPLINSSAIATIQGVLGISVVGNQITNTGVRTLTDGAGISTVIDPDTGIAEISNAGVTALNPEDNYITITGTNAARTIKNEGVLSITAAAGFSNIGTATEPNIRNEYVLSLTSPDNSVANTNTNSEQELRCLAPQLTRCFSAVVFDPALSLNGRVGYAVTTETGSLFESCLATGSPYSTGVFCIDFSPLVLIFGSVWWVGIKGRFVLCTFNDETSSPGNTKSYIVQIAARYPSFGPLLPGAAVSPCKVPFDLGVAISNGLKTVTSVTFSIPSDGSAPVLPVSTAGIFGVYYPNGLE